MENLKSTLGHVSEETLSFEIQIEEHTVVDNFPNGVCTSKKKTWERVVAAKP